MSRKISSLARKTTLAILRHFPKIRWRVRRVYWGYRHRQYVAVSRDVIVEQKTILFESYSGSSYACSPKAIFETLCSDPRFKDWKFFWSFKENQIKSISHDYPLLAERATLVERGSREYYEACSKVSFWVVNNRMPEWIYPKSDQKYIQCWHGTPLKRLGFDMPENATAALNTAKELSWRFQIDSKKWTYLLSPSSYCSEHLLTAFGLSPEMNCTVLEEGYPRNDAIANTLRSANSKIEIKKIKQRLNIPDNKQVLLYAPTWRDSNYDNKHGYVMDNELDFDLLQQRLGDKWIILLRTHYYVKNRIDLDRWSGFIFDVTNVNDINDLYLVTDVLVTDYSSVMFDYSNTGRPLILFFPDFEFYKNELHGFYIDPNEIPGFKCFTSEEVVSAIRSLDDWDNQFGKKYQEFHQRFCPMDDGCAAERVIGQILLR